MVQELVASQLTIVDPTGRPRIILGLSADNAPLARFLDDQGQERASLGLRVPPGAPGSSADLIAELRLEAGDGRVEARLLAGPEGYGVLELSQVTPDLSDTLSTVGVELWLDEGRPHVRASVRSPDLQADWWAQDGRVGHAVDPDPQGPGRPDSPS